MLQYPYNKVTSAAADDDFVICQNWPCKQVLVFSSRRLLHPAVDDNLLYVETHLMNKCLCCQAEI